MDMNCPRLEVRSEIGPLQAVLLHRPGAELNHLIPRFLGDLLFDEIPWLERAREEHAGFAAAITSAGAQVYYVEDLVTELIADRAIKEQLINDHLAFVRLVNPDVTQAVHDYLLELPDRQTVDLLIAGLSKDTVAPLKKHRHFSDLTTRSYPFFLDPMPSMYFTRDHGAMVRDRLLVSEMFNFARRRETLFVRYLQRFHPLFVETPLWIDGEIPTGIEGGDLLIINPQTLLVGFSERTTEQAIEYVAQKLLVEHQELAQIIVVQIPAKRAYMHLDTVFTMLDYDKFILYPGVEEKIEVYTLTRGLGDLIDAKREDDLRQTLSRALKISDVEIIRSGGHDPITAAREQWSDSTNTLTVAPGKVICYNRNQVTNRVLRERGLEVIEIEGSELVRGRGGPRCMSMPLAREEISW